MITRTSRRWYDSPWMIAGQAVSIALGVAVVAAVLAIVVVPRVTGGSSFAVLTGSMVPTFAPGDVIVDRGVAKDAVCREVSVGTIVTYMPKKNDPSLITHRVIGKTIGDFPDGTDCRIITQGDANSAVDTPVSPAQVRGVFLFGIPKLGWVRQWVSGNVPTVGVVLAVGLLAWWFLWPRRTKTRVIATPGAATGTASPGTTIATAESIRDRELYARELDIRERELALRERELAGRTWQSDSTAQLPTNVIPSAPAQNEAACPPAPLT